MEMCYPGDNVYWLVVQGLTAFETVFQYIPAVSQRKEIRRNMTGERKYSNNGTRTYCKHRRPLLYYTEQQKKLDGCLLVGVFGTPTILKPAIHTNILCFETV